MGRRNDDKNERPHREGRNRQRQRVLELVREYDDPIDAGELAAHLGLHTTTVRFHLDALCGEGVIERSRITRAGVGRPRTGYRTVRERLDYRILAEILALELGDTAEKRRRRAQAAGRRWAQRIAGEVPRENAAGHLVPGGIGPRGAVEDQSAMIARVFDRMGFGPEPIMADKPTAGNQHTIRLHSCPVRDLARHHPEVACALHLGLLQGLAAEPAGKGSPAVSVPWIQAELEPFVESELCLAKVTTRG